MKCITKAKRAGQGRGGTWRARNESSKGEEWRCVGDEERGEEPGEELRAVWGLGADGQKFSFLILFLGKCPVNVYIDFI